MFIKKLARLLLYGYKHSSASYINHLRSLGMQIGTDVTIYAPNKTLIDETSPYMITIGDHVQIAEGVKILSHDYSWAVLKCLDHLGNTEIKPGAILGSVGRVAIGNHVFIGMNAVILHGVQIGDFVIIGAGSVVTRDCEPGSVYAGAPAKRIMSIGDFYQKRAAAQLQEAKDIALAYYQRYGKRPGKEVFREHFFLFETADDAKKSKIFYQQILLCDNGTDTLRYMESQPPQFADYDAFMRYCFDEAEMSRT